MSSAAEAPIVVRHSSIESLAGFDSGTGKGLPVELYLSPRAGRVRAGNVRISGMLVLEVETQPVHALEGLGQLGMRRDGTTAPAAEQLLRHCGAGHCRCPCRPTESEFSGIMKGPPRSGASTGGTHAAPVTYEGEDGGGTASGTTWMRGVKCAPTPGEKSRIPTTMT